MNTMNEYLQLAPVRKDMYAFLARIFRVEVDQPFLDALGNLEFPTGEDDLFSEGIANLEAFLNNPGIDPRTDLAVDYARVFLGAGIADGTAAFPYESVYTSPEHLIMQDARDAVLALYREKNLGVADGSPEPEDHAAFELEFMAFLISAGVAAAENQDSAQLQASLREQERFLRLHLLNWMPALCKDIQKYSKTRFYPAIAKMTCGFLQKDQEVITELLEDASA